VSLILWSAFFAFLIGNVALFTPPLYRLLNRLLLRLKLSRIAAKIDRISGAFQIMGRNRSALVWSLAISFINQLIVISTTWILAVGLRLHVPFAYFFVFVPVITLISMIPISLNGMGLREYAFMSLFQSIGVPAASCIALGLLSSIMIVLSSLPGGIVYIFFRNRSDLEPLAAMEKEFS
jgi:hypothetical protein